MMQKKYSGGINIGTSSILVTFVLLAMVTFAALSYMSAESDYTLSREAANRSASYYDANRMGEIYLANIEALLAKEMSKSSSRQDYFRAIEGVFADNDKIVVRDEGGEKVYLQYTISVTNGQNLDVVLLAHYPDIDDDSLFHVERWATSVNEEWLNSVKNGDKESGTKLLFQ